MYLDKSEDNYIDKLKSMSYDELDNFAVELREFLIDSVAEKGGHLASNLGDVELTLALHKVFDTPKDKIVWDVGHQTYVHKILTGRKEGFKNLREIDHMSGFPKRAESVHDMYDSGHSSTSISAAYGYAVARDLKKEDYNCIAVIGDGALTGGVAYEALNVAGDSNTPLIVVINDNQMSISSSHGGMAEHLHDLRTSSSYLRFKRDLKSKVKDKPFVYSTLKHARDMIKYAIIPSGVFEELGFKYFGPIDGHNIKEMVETLELAKELKRPVVVHVVTKKGKGFVPAEKNPSKFHGIGSFDPNMISSENKFDEQSFSCIFGSKLAELAEKDERVCAITAAMLDATGLNKMNDKFPERVFDVGIAEQHAVSFAAGLALNGMKPVVAIYSTFLQRAYDQIITEVALQDLPVIFAIDRAGITGKDGETHQGMFDISFLNSMPNMTVLAPKDGNELGRMLEYALTLNGPVAIRFPRDKDYDLSSFESDPDVSKAELCGPDGNIAILAFGSMVKESLIASNYLRKDGYHTAVYNMRQAKPLQTEFLDIIKKKYARVITVEDGCLNGGFGQAAAEYIGETLVAPPVYCICWPDKFIEHGSIADLRSKYGMDAEGIARRCEAFFEKQA